MAWNTVNSCSTTMSVTACPHIDEAWKFLLKREPKHFKFLIIGSGPTGLGAAWRIEELGIGDYQILEAEHVPGGLSASVVDGKGFTWDMGGHVQFSHYRYYDAVLDMALGEHWLWHERESWVWTRNRFVPYPFQYNIHRLDPDDLDRAFRGLVSAGEKIRRGGARPRNFKQWIHAMFGEGLADIFMEPYNLKVWGYPPETMDCGWVGERVAVPDLRRVRRNIASGVDDVAWGPNNRFRYPKSGGTGAIWTQTAKLLPPERFRYGSRVCRINAERQRLTLDDGTDLDYDFLISSMPLDLLGRMTDGLPVGAQRAAQSMVHSAVHILGIGLRGECPESLRKKCWMYFPEANSPYFRVTVFSNYSPSHVPEGCWSLMAEVTETPHRPVEVRSLERWTRDALREDQLIADSSEIVSFWHRRLEHGYPTPFLGRDEALQEAQAGLENQQIFSRGRFGGWKHEVANQDHKRLYLRRPRRRHTDHR